MKQTRLRAIFATLGCFVLCFAPVTGAAAERKPNIIFILADDLGWTDLGVQGSTYYETPHIDRLAARGMRFTSGYTAGPNCTPTRAALMSGQYGARTGVFTVGSIDRFDWRSRPLAPPQNVQNLPRALAILPQPLKDAGYATAMYGKWHLGNAGEFHPSKRGFDEALATAGKHFDFVTDPPVEYPRGQYLADFLTEKAVAFITKNKDKPFFLYLPHFGVHAPKEAKPELIEKFKTKPAAGGHHDPVYAAMIYSVDESVGRIMATLDELKLAEDTLVIFSSDNGGVGGYVREGIKPPGKETTDNTPLRGGKGMLYEGGVRVPFIFRWPGKVKPGTTSDTPIISVDLYPTLLEVAQAKAPANQPLDGVSLLPALQGGALEREAIYWHFPGYLGAGGVDKWRTKPVCAVRSGDFKLLEWYEDGKLELYNLKTDIGQTQNLAEKEPEVARQLHAKLLAWRESVGAKIPPKNENPQPPSAAKNRKRARNADDDE